MKIRDKCLPCLVNQVIKVAYMTEVTNKEALYHKVFEYLSHLDFDFTNPEIIGQTFQMVKDITGNDDPYRDIRHFYNQMFLEHRRSFQEKIEQSKDEFTTAVKYAVIGNIIDFNPVYNHNIKDIMKWFENVDQLDLTINHVDELKTDLKNAHTLLYLGDNCGEICLDYLFIEKIKDMNPQLDIYFGVRGEPVVNDSIAEDAYYIGMDQYAKIISNGDCSLGTILKRISPEFRDVYQNADVVIAKGQANYESLSEEVEKNIYFMLMVKCDVISEDIGVPEKSMVCLNFGHE